MANYTSVVTLDGQAKIADAIGGGDAINLTDLAVGDGNGALVTPLEPMTALVHEVWRGSVLSASRDPQNPTQLIVTAEIPVEAGPFTVREAALFTDDGKMFAMASYPETYKPGQGEGAVAEITLEFVVVVDTAANVAVTISADQLISISGMLRPPFIAIDSFAATPPADPADGALVVVADGATGGFAGFDHQFAQWNGSVWVHADAPLTTIVGNAVDGGYYRRTATGWKRVTGEEFPLIKRAVESADIAWPPTSPTFDELAEAISRYGLVVNNCTAAGDKDTHTVSIRAPFVKPTALIDGLTIEYTPPDANDGPVDIVAFGLASKPLLDIAGEELVGGEVGAAPIRATYSAAEGGFLLAPWTSALKPSGIPKAVLFFDASDTYTPSSPDVTGIEVEQAAPGGGGGGVDGQGSGTAACALGGHSGEIITTFIPIADAANYSALITIGAPGPGGAPGNNNGGDGGDVVFDDGTNVLTAKGGKGGDGRTGNSTVSLLSPANSTIPTSGTIRIPSQRPTDANMLLGDVATRSTGGPSPYGAPQRPGLNAYVDPSLGYVSGGTGAATQDTVGNYAGGDAAPGFLRIKEF